MSNLYIDIKYAKIVSQRIERWKIKKESPFHGSGRCPICGDSSTNKNKTRFHIIQHSDTLFVKCFNCDYSTNLLSFLKVYHADIYSEYAFERYRVGNSDLPTITNTIPPEPTRTHSKQLSSLGLGLVSELDLDHPLRRYVASRQLPQYPFLYAPRFYEFSSKYNEDFKQYKTDEPRLVIPFFDRGGNVYAYQGRDLNGKSNQKYITVIIDKKTPKIFGIGCVDFKKPITIVEGPLDSLFLKNSLASVNASLVSTAVKLKSVININQITLAYDNEPRNVQITKMYHDAIKLGYNIVIWPKEVDGIKDINEMVIKGFDPTKIIGQNTYSGLSAQLQLQKWKKC